MIDVAGNKKITETENTSISISTSTSTISNTDNDRNKDKDNSSTLDSIELSIESVKNGSSKELQIRAESLKRAKQKKIDGALKHKELRMKNLNELYEYEIEAELKRYKLQGTSIETIPELTDLYREYYLAEEHYRQSVNDAIPRTPLFNKHLQGAELLTSRKALLRRLPVNGIAAELGVANGDFSSSILSVNSPSKLHLIDIWGSQRYNNSLYKNVLQKFNTEISKGKMEIHRKLSTEAVEDFEDNYFDWLYIDTSHCYKGTKAELELYASKVKTGGVIAGHDYMMGNWTKQYRYGVMEAVHEFCVNAGWRIKFLTMDMSENQSFAIERIR